MVSERGAEEKNSRINLFHYKVWFIHDVLETIEELKHSASKGSAGYIVKVEKKSSHPRPALFEALVNKYVDVENIIDRLEEPYRTIIREKLFLQSYEEVKKALDLPSREEARKLVRKAVNTAYHRLSRYLGKGM